MNPATNPQQVVKLKHTENYKKVYVFDFKTANSGELLSISRYQRSFFPPSFVSGGVTVNKAHSKEGEKQTCPLPFERAWAHRMKHEYEVSTQVLSAPVLPFH